MKHFDVGRAYAISQKEIYHVLRDPFTISLAILLPLMTVLIFGYAMEFNVKEIPTSYLDMDKTESSRIFLETMGSSNYFKLSLVKTPDEGLKAIESESAKAFLYIPPNFEKNIISGLGENIQIVIDGTDNSFVGAINGYLSLVKQMAIKKITGVESPSKVNIRTKYLFNPELNSQWFSIPGIAVVIMAILCSLLTTLTVAKEWENGSMELLLSTPVKPIEIIIGKLTPYAFLCLGSVIFVYFLARFWFNIPFVGSHWIFGLATLLFLIGYLAIGLTISVLIRSQLPAMQAGIMVGMLPSTLLSGFIFSIDNMPQFFQWITVVLPARWYMQVVRDQFLKGSNFSNLILPISVLFFIAAILVVVSSLNFKKDLE